MTFITMRMCAIGAFVMQLFCLSAFAQTLEPYQASRSIADSTACPSAQCTLDFPVVPSGKRLVLDSVSAQLGLASDVLVLEGNGVSYYVTKSHPNLGYLTVPVTVYFDAGNTPRARISSTTNQHTSLIVTLVGHLVPQVSAVLLSITTNVLPQGVVGQAFSAQLMATGGTGPYTWAASPPLPTGLSLDVSSGVISGVPIGSSNQMLTFTLTDQSPTPQTANKALQLIIAPSTLIITTTSLPLGMVGQPYNHTLQATGGTGALTWSITAGILPAGLTLNATTGAISGTPIMPAGTSSFTVQVQDAGGLSDTQLLSMTINLPNPPQIATTTLPGGTVGQPYSQTLHATGGVGVLTWSVTTGSLPAGLTLSSSGTISGTPTTPGTSNFTVRVVDTFNQSDTQSLPLAISTVLAITTTSLPNAKEGQAYSTILQSSGGVPPLTWSVTPPLPNGLNLNPATGQITGTPVAGAQGAQTFLFTVQDSTTPTPQVVHKPLTLVIAP